MPKTIKQIILKYLITFILVLFLMPWINGEAMDPVKKILLMFVIWSLICMVEIFFEQRKLQRLKNKNEELD